MCGLGKIFKTVAPIALSLAMPELAPALAGGLGITSAAGIAGIGAGLGGLGGVLTGGGLKGGILGGLSGGLGAGGGAALLGPQGLNLGLTAPTMSALSGAGAGAAAGGINGGIGGALLGAGLGGAGGYVQGSGGFGNAYDNLTGGATPSANGSISPVMSNPGANNPLGGISTSGGTGGLTTSASSPFNTLGNPNALASQTTAAAPATKTAFGSLTNMVSNDPLGALAAAGSIYSNVNQQQQQKDLLKQQQADNTAYNNYMINALNTPVTPRTQLPVDLTNYGHTGGEGQFFNDGVQKFAAGGMVGSMQDPDMSAMPASTAPMPQQSPLAGMVSGAGGGQDDKVPIMAADGEHVVPADVVSMLGDGSSKQGSNKLRKLEQNVRKAKGVKNIKTIPKKIKANLSAYTG